MFEDLFLLITMAVLLFLSACFSGTETAFTSLSQLQVEKLSNEHVTGKFVRKIASNKKKLIITVLIGNNLVNILLSVLFTVLAMNLFGDSAVAVVTGVLTFILLLFGEIIPKTYSSAHNESIARITAIPAYYLQKILFPVIWFFEVITKVLFFRQKEQISDLFGDSELASILDVGVSQKSFTESEKETIMRFLSIDDTPANKVMTPLDSVFALDLHTKAKDALPLILKERFSRIPLYDQDKSSIMGFIHMKDVYDLKKEDENKELYLFSRGVVKVSETRAVSDIFKEMLNFRTHIAVVVRDNKAWGIITMEDVLEEFIGDIYDEKDKVAHDIKAASLAVHSAQSAKRQYVIEGSSPVSAVEVIIKQALPRKSDDESVSEMLSFFINDPKPKKSVIIGGVIFRVMSVEKGVITKVKVINQA